MQRNHLFEVNEDLTEESSRNTPKIQRKMVKTHISHNTEYTQPQESKRNISDLAQ